LWCEARHSIGKLGPVKYCMVSLDYGNVESCIVWSGEALWGGVWSCMLRQFLGRAVWRKVMFCMVLHGTMLLRSGIVRYSTAQSGLARLRAVG